MRGAGSRSGSALKWKAGSGCGSETLYPSKTFGYEKKITWWIRGPDSGKNRQLCHGRSHPVEQKLLIIHTVRLDSGKPAAKYGNFCIENLSKNGTVLYVRKVAHTSQKRLCTTQQYEYAPKFGTFNYNTDTNRSLGNISCIPRQNSCPNLNHLRGKIRLNQVWYKNSLLKI